MRRLQGTGKDSLGVFTLDDLSVLFDEPRRSKRLDGSVLVRQGELPLARKDLVVHHLRRCGRSYVIEANVPHRTIPEGSGQ